MPTITVLDETTINKIAAGEVIERPASVVKELLENAIDAQATVVTVEIRDGGCSLIRITDNGCGIPKDQVATAFLRHATSKIHTVDDLMTIGSLGFRGEALASIAAVSQVELISKTAQTLTGIRYQIEGGREKSLEEIGAPEGTTIIARNLFFNTPARKKFLKTPVTEGTHVASVVEKIALSHPDISIRFIQNNQNKLYTSGNNNLKDLIYTVFGREITANLLEVHTQGTGITITGYIGKPVIARSNRNYENYFVNGRFVRSNILSKAIEEAYKPFMMQHKYPFTMLHFQIDPQTLDVNVHPTKMELRFSDGEFIYDQTVNAVSNALAHKELIPDVNLNEKGEQDTRRSEEKKAPRPEPFETRRKDVLEQQKLPSAEKSAAVSAEGSYRQIAPPKPSFVKEPDISDMMPEWLKERKKAEEEKLNAFGKWNSDTTNVKKSQNNTDSGNGEQASVDRNTQPDFVSKNIMDKPVPDMPAAAPKQLDLFGEKLLDPSSRLKHKLIGQLFDTYWLIEYNDHLYIIDQHAAHEKVLYEKTVKSLKDRDYNSQMVEPPIILTLNPNEELLLNKYMEYFTHIGFEIEPFGGREFAVRAVPANLFSVAKKDLLLEMIDGLSDEMAAHSPYSIYEKIASMSCKAAVKG
ncbi:MAG: DNA mismatch repair endonuclease MutL, partial [Enterocloster sp.]